jgi:hypothetical protein
MGGKLAIKLEPQADTTPNQPFPARCIKKQTLLCWIEISVDFGRGRKLDGLL